ncbi:MAG: HD-GYP domain-containing protein [Deinococcales bacterium]
MSTPRDELEFGLSGVLDSAAAGLVLNILAQHDPDTYAHSERVSKLVVRIGQELHLCTEELEELRLGALLHDIGKISVNLGILHKPSKLAIAEFDKIKSHTVLGEEFLNHIPGLEKFAAIARSHHERFDGTGYPDGLVGQDIPMLARIVAVADGLDVMFNGRVYQKRRTPREIILEISKSIYSHFDPQVVNALMNAWQSGALPLEEAESDLTE